METVTISRQKFNQLQSDSNAYRALCRTITNAMQGVLGEQSGGSEKPAGQPKVKITAKGQLAKKYGK